MINMSIQPLWLTHFIEILLVLQFQLTKFIIGPFSYKAHFRPQISSNVVLTQLWKGMQLSKVKLLTGCDREGALSHASRENTQSCLNMELFPDHRYNIPITQVQTLLSYILGLEVVRKMITMQEINHRFIEESANRYQSLGHDNHIVNIRDS